MSEEFPPRAEHLREIEILTEVLTSVVDGRSALYVSSPLTTGQRAFEWHRKNSGVTSLAQMEPHPAFRRDVMEPNRDEAARFTRDLRETSNRLVIDPTAVGDLPGWTQADYRVFWGRVIERYVETAVFRDGWQYSSGCAYEFLAASTAGAQLLNEDLTPLALEEGRALLADAVRESRTRGLPAEFLEHVLETLEETAMPHLDR